MWSYWRQASGGFRITKGLKHSSYEGRQKLGFQLIEEKAVGLEGSHFCVKIEPNPFQGCPVRRKEEDARSKLKSFVLLVVFFPTVRMLSTGTDCPGRL